MTDEEKLIALKTAILPDTEADGVLMDTLSTAEELVLNRMYPFGTPDDAAVPSRYERIQIALAVELYTKRGAEGQSSHSENGITRTWPERSRLLSQIIPRAGSVVSDA